MQIPPFSTICPHCAEPLARAGSVVAAQIPAGGAVPPDGTRPCPSCGEWFDMTRWECPRCEHRVAAIARPFWPAERVRWERDVMIVPGGTELPPVRCLFCGGREHIMAWTKEFVWMHPALSALLLLVVCFGVIGIIIAAVVYYTARKTLKVTLPRCEPCRDRQTTASTAGVLGGAGAVILLPLVFGVAGNYAIGGDAAYWMALGGAVAGLVVLLVVHSTWVRRRTVTVRRIDEMGAHLRVPYPHITREALEAMAGPAQ